MGLSCSGEYLVYQMVFYTIREGFLMDFGFSYSIKIAQKSKEIFLYKEAHLKDIVN